MDTPPVVVVYAADRELRRQGDTLLRAAGVHTRVASRPAELAKALGVGMPALIVLGDHADEHVQAVLAPVLAASPAMSVMYQAPGESIGMIVARALGAVGRSTDQPRSSE